MRTVQIPPFDIPDIDMTSVLDRIADLDAANNMRHAEMRQDVAELRALIEALDDEEPPLPPLEQIRGIRTWASGHGTATDIDARLACFEKAGVNAIHFAVYWREAYYASELMESRSFDSLAYVLPRAHDRGMQVFALMPVACIGWPDYPEWNARTARGMNENWLDFTNADARAFVGNVVAELSEYDIDGVLLDYIRSKCSVAPSVLPAADITAMVAGVRNSMPEEMTLAASVFAGLRWGAGIGAGRNQQDWYGWLDAGLVDYVCPMAYFESNVEFWDQLDLALTEWDNSGHFPARIKPRLSVRRAEVLAHITHCYERGADGMTLWNDHDLCANTDLVEALGADGW